MRLQRIVEVKIIGGLHLRAGASVATAASYHDDTLVQIFNKSTGEGVEWRTSGPANSQVAFKLMLLAILDGGFAKIVTEGPHAQEVMDAVCEVLNSDGQRGPNHVWNNRRASDLLPKGTGPRAFNDFMMRRIEAGFALN